jgi:hypothetical protein
MEHYSYHDGSLDSDTIEVKETFKGLLDFEMAQPTTTCRHYSDLL